MRVEPCTEYWLAARRLNAVDTDWELIVEDKESVPGCNADEEWKKAGGHPASRPPATIETPKK